MKLQFNKEFKIGLLVFLALAGFIWGINFLKNSDIFSKHRSYYAIYDQVNGLTVSAPVIFKGLKIGSVKEVGFMEDGSSRILVKFQINNSIQIPVHSTAKIYSSDLMGSKAVEIVFSKEARFAGNNDTLSGLVQASLAEEVSVQVLPIKKKAESIFTSLDSVLIAFQGIFNENTRLNLSKSFESIKIAIDNLKNTTFNIDTLVSTQRNRLSRILGNIESISSNIEKNNDKISSLLKNFSSISDTLAKSNLKQVIDNAGSAVLNISQVFEKINQGKGSLGLLVNSDSLYDEIHHAAVSLDKLLKDIKTNPDRYINISVFGSKKSN